MASKFPGQHENEEIDLVFRQHPIVMRKSLILALALFTAGILPLAYWPLEQWVWWVAGAGLLLAALAFGYRFLGWYFSVYIITDERLVQIRQKGFFNRSVQDISHSRVQSVQYEVKGVQATLFKFGTIAVQTYAGPVLTLTFIHRPEEVQEHLNKIIRSIKPAEPWNANEESDDEESAEKPAGKN